MNGIVVDGSWNDLKGAGLSSTTVSRSAASKTQAKAGRRRKAVSCEQCFFGTRGLCALNLGGPCSTFRPDHPEGLVPPLQPALLIRDGAIDVAVAA